MNSDELSLAIDEKEKAVQHASETLNIILESKYKLERELIELTEAARKARFIIRRLRSEKDILEREYWRARG